MNQLLMWTIFGAFVIFLLILDLCILNKKPHEIKIKEALLWSLFYIILALLFNVYIYFRFNKVKALEFLSAYLLEYSLSVDNLFVFLLLFSYFRIPIQYQHKVLFWGIVGAIIMRLIFIIAGSALIKKFHWTIYLLGGFLVLTGIKISFEKKDNVNPEKNIFIKIFRRFMPCTGKLRGARFFIKKMGKLIATPLFICLLAIETTDIIFATDSVPAVLALSRDPLIVYTSNIFAILGLRALFFALAGIMQLFCYLKYGLSIILVFIGIKMIMESIYEVPISVALGFIAVTLIISIIASLIWTKTTNQQP